MIIDNKNKYISVFKNVNIEFIFYKKELYAILDKNKNIAYVKDLNKKSLFEFIDSFQYEIIEVKNIETILNKIEIN